MPGALRPCEPRVLGWRAGARGGRGRLGGGAAGPEASNVSPLLPAAQAGEEAAGGTGPAAGVEPGLRWSARSMVVWTWI